VRNTDLAFSGFVLVVAVTYEAMALWMPQGSLKFPGPGYYPRLVGIFLIATSMGCLVQAALARRGSQATAPTTVGMPLLATKMVLLLVLLVAYALLLKPAGFPIAIFLFLLAAIRVFGYRKWAMTVLIAIGLTMLSYLTFISWLKVPLPLGFIGDLLD
jgi:putative tricarboxylic transport membrane protein